MTTEHMTGSSLPALRKTFTEVAVELSLNFGDGLAGQAAAVMG